MRAEDVELWLKENGQSQVARRRHFATPLRKAFRRLNVARKKTVSGFGVPGHKDPLGDCSNKPGFAPEDPGNGDEHLEPPPAPRPSRLATPGDPPSPISPLPVIGSRASNLLTSRSRFLSTPISQGSVRFFGNDVPSSSSPAVQMPRGNLFHLGLTPIRPTEPGPLDWAVREPLFAPALSMTQRVSTVNVATLTAQADIQDALDMDIDSRVPNPGQVTPTPSRTAPVQQLPALPPTQGSSKPVMFGSSGLGSSRRTSFMSKLVGSAWGFAGSRFASANSNRRSKITPLELPPAKAMISRLPSVPVSKNSLERAVLGIDVTRQPSVILQGSRLQVPADELPPANSTLRMTGSKSSRALDDFDQQEPPNPEGTEVKIEERPKKKRRNVADQYTPAPSPPTTRVTRSMAVLQTEAEKITPTRVTRSTSKKLAGQGTTPTRNWREEVPLRPKTARRL